MLFAKAWQSIWAKLLASFLAGSKGINNGHDRIILSLFELI